MTQTELRSTVAKMEQKEMPPTGIVDKPDPRNDYPDGPSISCPSETGSSSKPKRIGKKLKPVRSIDADAEASTRPKLEVVKKKVGRPPRAEAASAKAPDQPQDSSKAPLKRPRPEVRKGGTLFVS